MSDVKDDGGFAFPMGFHRDGNSADQCGGLRIRDWFAGQALAGRERDLTDTWGPMDVAEQAYRIADAMLAAREAKQ